MKKLAIISEFNPFHNGHKYLLDKAKEDLACDLAISFMSGDFVQRGEAAIVDKFTRAKTAVENGFDLVIEMPNFISLQAAEFFALKSLEILDKMEIDYLCFGIERLDERDFLDKAKIVINNDNFINQELKKYLSNGISYTKALNSAISKLVGDDFISANNILALEYMKAIDKLKSKIIPYPICRVGSLNKDKTINDKFYASSTAIRNNISGDISKLMPRTSFKNFSDFFKNYDRINDDFFYKIFTYKLIVEKKAMTDIIGYEEGIENHLIKLVDRNRTFDDFINEATSLRYTKSRVRRLILNYILDNSFRLNYIDIHFIRILAYNRKATKIFNNFNDKVDIVINKADSKILDQNNFKIYEKMINSSNLYNLAIEREINYDYIHNNKPFK
ncbi:nucleotidyltransferase family protein [Anaerococcus sp. NML200574]|uniref:tRNA(Met) cytidine acetate ligase n=1 Tax=Anaerococcus sp. NML200574 TaxID=2954486 RepID=UPI0022390F21|nr:nucleotidyltransferase family protein [Anaerococcus sp. NML200574]MCW6677833.1 nucleotidyltransferase family protein [Anaerococcus sp. NML200574]